MLIKNEGWVGSWNPWIIKRGTNGVTCSKAQVLTQKKIGLSFTVHTHSLFCLEEPFKTKRETNSRPIVEVVLMECQGSYLGLKMSFMAIRMNLRGFKGRMKAYSRDEMGFWRCKRLEKFEYSGHSEAKCEERRRQLKGIQGESQTMRS